ncbi:MAG: methyltransferase domain-containing protein, partial [Treponema sp.]|nr:methyltransferase domain-containing protein [Treponema sp.]
MSAKQTPSLIEKYYNKFNEDHRLTTRHGQVEFNTTMHFIKKYISQNAIVLDLGAGTGKYSLALCDLGCDVTAVELVKRNIEVLRSHHKKIKTWQADARDIHFLDDEKFDLTLVFGPLYHLHGDENKLKVLNEAKRVTKKGGIIMVAYVMNEYSVLTYCFQENRMAQIKKDG